MHVLRKQAIYDKKGNVAFWEVFVQGNTARKHSEDIDPLRDDTDNFGFERIDYLPLLNKTHFVKIDIKNSPYDLNELKEVIAIVKSLKRA